MCGICGIVNIDEQEVISSAILTQMTNAIIHRGPDDAGEFIDKNIGLAMRRLKIIDLDTGHQPMHNEDNTIWIVFNGEIYNFLDLKKDLLEKGHRFYSKGDTEVIIHLYEEEGDSCVNKLNGMFAFAIWDSHKRKLFLARDRMGQKPLYYSFKNGQLIFASEIKSLLVHPSVSRQLDLDALNEYLTFEYIPAPRSVFQDIKKLPASHTLVLEKEKLLIDRYWNVRLGGLNGINEIEASDLAFSLLKDSVKRHLISDVPLGIFLSGGVDSSTIAVLASRLVNNKLKTFSVSFDEESFDESSYADLVAHSIGSEHYEMKFSAKDCLAIVPYIYDIIDEPFADASILPTYILSRFTRKYVTVALGGDGADELLAGYPTHIAHYFADKLYLNLPHLLRKHFIEAIGKKLPTSFDNFSWDFKIKKFISGVEFSPEIRHQIWMGAFSPAQKDTLFLTSVKKIMIETEGLNPLFNNLQELSSEDAISSQRKILFSDMRLYLQDDILTKVDRASMANSLEARCPYLDNNLVEFINSLDTRLKMKRMHTKLFFKRMLLTKKILPSKIINRPKKGFGIPVAKWINNDLKDMVLDLLSEKSIKRDNLFNYPYIKQILKRHFDFKEDNRKLIWTLFMFQLWKRKFLK